MHASSSIPPHEYMVIGMVGNIDVPSMLPLTIVKQNDLSNIIKHLAGSRSQSDQLFNNVAIQAW
jgi:hypothetical protein